MATLDEGISKIVAGSTLDKFYNKLLKDFEGASKETLPDFTGPDYVSKEFVVDTEKIQKEISDYNSITLKNASYKLANTILTSLGFDPGAGGEGGGETPEPEPVGPVFTKKVAALYGFEAGDDGLKFFETYRNNEVNYVKVGDAQFHVNSSGIYINDIQAISMTDQGVLKFENDAIALNGAVTCDESITLDKLIITKDGITLDGKIYYHAGNANLNTVDWTMKDGAVAGNLGVKGTTTLEGQLNALNTVYLGFNGDRILDIDAADKATLHGDLDIVKGGVKIDGSYVIHKKNNNVISFSAAEKTLNFGDDQTAAIALQAGIYDANSKYELITTAGAGYFPASFRAGHNGGRVLIHTYSNETETAVAENADTLKDTGIVIDNFLRFKDESGPIFYSDGRDMFYQGKFFFAAESTEGAFEDSKDMLSSLTYQASNSLYAPLNKKAVDFKFVTAADFYVFDKPLEGETSIGISGSKTRILDNQLFFNDGIYWQGIIDGVKHYGNAYMVNDIGSVKFSSGFAGSGWKIYKNKVSGNICATFDELTVRKKMRIYELEVQKISATNGSLWVSSSCSGDMVEEIL